MFHSYDYFSPGVTCIQIPEGLRSLAQRVRSVDDRCDLSRFNELPQNNQVLMVRYRNKRASLLAHERWQYERLDNVAHASMAGVRYESSLGGERASAV